MQNKAPPGFKWEPSTIRNLRLHRGESPEGFAQTLGIRTEVVKAWERGDYAPVGVSDSILYVVADASDFEY